MSDVEFFLEKRLIQQPASDGFWVSTTDIRDLLDELTRLRASLNYSQTLLPDLIAENERLRASLAEAEQDSKRLDWLDTIEDGILEKRIDGVKETLWWRMPSHLRGRYDNPLNRPIRAAIDAAALHTTEDPK